MGLHPLDLIVEGGERLALIGPNGSGKTTLARLLATDLLPSGGELDLLGHPAGTPTPALRRRIGYAGDRPIHWEPLTGAENLRFFWEVGRSWEGRRSRPEESNANALKHRSPMAMAMALGLGPVLDEPVSRYSFGMRRRLLLAEVLASGAELLLFDEPTVGLDPSGVVALGRELRVRAREGAAVVLATNEVREIPDWATRVLFLHEGRVVADDSPGGLLERVRGRTLVTVRFRPGDREAEAGGESVPAPGPPGSAGEGSASPSPFSAVPALLRDDETLVGVDQPSTEAPRKAGPDGPKAFSRGGRSRLETLRIRTPRGARLLPRLLEALMDHGAEIRDVRVREPDLRDVFRELTGRELNPSDPGAGPPRAEG